MLDEQMKTGGRGRMSNPRVSGPVREVPPPLPNKGDTGVFWPEGKAPAEARPYTGPKVEDTPNSPPNPHGERQLLGLLTPEHRAKKIEELKEREAQLYALYTEHEQAVDKAEDELERLWDIEEVQEIQKKSLEENWPLLSPEMRERVLVELSVAGKSELAKAPLSEAMKVLPESVLKMLKTSLAPSQLADLIAENIALQERIKDELAREILKARELITYGEQLETSKVEPEYEEPVRKPLSRLQLESRRANLTVLAESLRKDASKAGIELAKQLSIPTEGIAIIANSFPDTWSFLKMKASREQLVGAIQSYREKLRQYQDETTSPESLKAKISKEELLAKLETKFNDPAMDVGQLSTLLTILDSYRTVALDIQDMDQQLKAKQPAA